MQRELGVIVRKFAFLSLLALLFGVLPAQSVSAAPATISGTVTAADGGAALEGVTVSLLGTASTTTTDAAGAYTVAIPSPPPMYTVVTFEKTGFAPTFSVASGSTVDAQLGEAAVIEGTVRSAGSPLAGATVAASFQGCPIPQFCPSTTTDADGHYSLTGFVLGSVGGVRVTKTGYVAAMSESVTPAAGQSYTRDVNLNQQGSVAGVVTGPGGSPAAGVTVSTPGNMTGIPRTVTTDEDGAYAFDQLNAGYQYFTFTKAGYATVTRQVIVSGGEQANLDLEMSLGNTIRVTVLDDAGDPATDVSLAYTTPNGLAGPIAAQSGSTVELADVEDGTYKFRASAYGLLTEWYEDADSVAGATGVTVAGGQTRDIEMRLAPGATLVVPFTNGPTGPMGNLSVTACAFTGRDERPVQCQSSSSSPIRITGLSPSRFQVLVYTTADKRYWIGGGSERSTGKWISAAAGQSVTVRSTNLSTPAGPMLAFAAPTITRTQSGYKVTVRDPQGYLATGVYQSNQYRLPGEETWTTSGGLGSDIYLPAHPRLEVRVQGLGQMGSFATPWSPIGYYLVAPQAPSATVTGSTVKVDWAAVTDATEYRVLGLYGGETSWVSGWQSGTSFTMTNAQAGKWRFAVQARRPEVTSARGPYGEVVRVRP